MPYYPTGLTLAVDGIAAGATWIAAHTADPAGTVGANQTGPRVQTTWAAAAGTDPRNRTGSQVAIAVAAGVTVTHWSVNTAQSGGAMAYSAALTTGETFSNPGSLLHTPTIAVGN
jgi:hypothetical protein